MTQQYSNRKIQRNNTIEFDRRQNYHKLVFNFHLRVTTVMYNLPYPRILKKKVRTLNKKKVDKFTSYIFYFSQVEI